MRILRPSEIQEFPEPKALSAEDLAQALALANAAFTAEDLQRYTEEEDGIPMEEVLRDLEAIQRQMDQRAA
jgi:hypothetical protein